MEINGMNQTNLSNDPGDDFMQFYSPNGEQIIFVSTRDGNEEIYIMDIDGENQFNLTMDDGSDLEPAFSPDGSKVIFISNREGFYGIYTVNTDGSELTYLSTSSNGDYSPNYSSDGSKILYQSYINDNYEIFMMNADGTNQINLTNNNGSDKEPQFQPSLVQDSLEIEFTVDWNLIGLPLGLVNQGIDSIFPESIAGTLFSFDETYFQEQEMEFGNGYWLRFNSNGSTFLSGIVINEWIIEVSSGWNIIGGISTPVSVNDFILENNLILPETVFEFYGSYVNADILIPGKGYWIRTIQEGFITISSQN